MSHRVEVWAMDRAGEGANIHSWDDTTIQPRVGEWIITEVGKNGSLVEAPITRVAYNFAEATVEVHIADEVYRRELAKITQFDERVK